MSLRIEITTQRENQSASARLFSSSPEKKDRTLALRTNEENIHALEPSTAPDDRYFKPLTSSYFQLSTPPRNQQLLAKAARTLIKKANRLFNQQGPSEDSIKLCKRALEIPFINDGLRWEGLSLLALFHEKRARSETAEPWDLNCAISAQEALLQMEYNSSPIAKAKLNYMIARNVFTKALQEHDLLGVDRTIFIMKGILAQDCLNPYQRLGLERNLAKAFYARSFLEPEKDEWLTYLS